MLQIERFGTEASFSHQTAKEHTNSLKMNSMLMIVLTAVVFSTYAEVAEVGIRDVYNACKLSSLKVTYNQVTLETANCDRKFNRKDNPDELQKFKTLPRVQWMQADENSFYTLIIINPWLNAKFLHWGVSNIKGAALKKGWSISQVETKLSEYKPPQWEIGRYQFFIYRQSSYKQIPGDFKLQNIEYPNMKNPKLTPHQIPVKDLIILDMKDLASKLQLRGPLAGYQLQFE